MTSFFNLKTLTIFIAFTLFQLPAISAAEPQNLSLLKQQLIQYHDSGKYYHTISKKIRHAIYYLRFRVTQNQRLKNHKKLAIVLDIDETSLSNYQDLRRLNFGGTEDEVNAAEAAGHDPAIPYTKSLYQYAIDNHVAVFFVTGRTESVRKATVRNLMLAGYSNWTKLYMKPNNYKNASVIPYKSGIRKQISQQGYDIVLNIGDQLSDLQGGFADMSFKLPDPYYYIS